MKRSRNAHRRLSSRPSRSWDTTSFRSSENSSNASSDTAFSTVTSFFSSSHCCDALAAVSGSSFTRTLSPGLHSATAGTHFSGSPSNSTMASLSPSRRRSWWSEASKQTRKQGPW